MALVRTYRISPNSDARLVGRCAALALAAEVARRAQARRDRAAENPPQPLSGYLAAQTAELVAAAPEDRAVTLEALREDSRASRDEHDRRVERRRELHRR